MSRGFQNVKVKQEGVSQATYLLAFVHLHGINPET